MGLENHQEITLRYSLRDTSKAEDVIGEDADAHEPLWKSKSGYHFEFITSAEYELQSTDLCPADDIFASGKLLPMKKHHCDFCKFPLMQTDRSPIAYHRQTKDHVHRRDDSESSSDSIKRPVVVRNCSWKSEGSSSVSSNSSNMHDLDRNYSYKSNRTTSSGSPRRRWQSFITGMGMVMYPYLEMELRDIKRRQSRRKRPASLFTGTPDSGRVASWGLIKALSCKGITSTY